MLRSIRIAFRLSVKSLYWCWTPDRDFAGQDAWQDAGEPTHRSWISRQDASQLKTSQTHFTSKRSRLREELTSWLSLVSVQLPASPTWGSTPCPTWGSTPSPTWGSTPPPTWVSSLVFSQTVLLQVPFHPSRNISLISYFLNLERGFLECIQIIVIIDDQYPFCEVYGQYLSTSEMPFWYTSPEIWKRIQSWNACGTLPLLHVLASWGVGSMHIYSLTHR